MHPKHNKGRRVQYLEAFAALESQGRGDEAEHIRFPRAAVGVAEPVVVGVGEAVGVAEPVKVGVGEAVGVGVAEPVAVGGARLWAWTNIAARKGTHS